MALAVHVGILLDAAESDPELLDDIREDFVSANAVLAENQRPVARRGARVSDPRPRRCVRVGVE
jgi:hypothetical protein